MCSYFSKRGVKHIITYENGREDEEESLFGQTAHISPHPISGPFFIQSLFISKNGSLRLSL